MRALNTVHNDFPSSLPRCSLEVPLHLPVPPFPHRTSAWTHERLFPNISFQSREHVQSQRNSVILQKMFPRSMQITDQTWPYPSHIPHPNLSTPISFNGLPLDRLLLLYHANSGFTSFFGSSNNFPLLNLEVCSNNSSVSR